MTVITSKKTYLNGSACIEMPSKIESSKTHCHVLAVSSVKSLLCADYCWGLVLVTLFCDINRNNPG